MRDGKGVFQAQSSRVGEQHQAQVEDQYAELRQQALAGSEFTINILPGDDRSRIGAEVEKHDAGTRSKSEQNISRAYRGPRLSSVPKKEVFDEDDDDWQGGGDFLAAEG